MRVADCNIVCGPGQHLADMTNCKKCSVGTYSTGKKQVQHKWSIRQIWPKDLVFEQILTIQRSDQNNSS